MWDAALKPSTDALAFSLLHMLPTRQESNQKIDESLLIVALSDRLSLMAHTPSWA